MAAVGYRSRSSSRAGGGGVLRAKQELAHIRTPPTRIPVRQSSVGGEVSEFIAVIDSIYSKLYILLHVT